MNRKEMLIALTQRELEFLQDHNECIYDSAVFFSEGGWSKYSDEKIEFLYKRDVEEEV